MGRPLIININKHTIGGNRKHGRYEPPIRVADTKYGPGRYFHEVRFYNQSGSLVYHPDEPLKCGARLWFELKGPCIGITKDGQFHRVARMLPKDWDDGLTYEENMERYYER